MTAPTAALIALIALVWAVLVRIGMRCADRPAEPTPVSFTLPPDVEWECPVCNQRVKEPEFNHHFDVCKLNLWRKPCSGK